MIAQLRQLSSDLLARASFARFAGITFGGKRDLYETCGYERILLPEHFRDRWMRGGLAARVVEALPKATWRGGAELIEDEDPLVETQFEAGWIELEKRLGIWNVLQRADILAGIGRYSVVLIGAPGELSAPLPKKLTAEQIVYLQPFSEEDARIDKFEEDASSPRFGQALTYTLTRSTTHRQQHRANLRSARNVHFSRVIHIADECLDDRLYGTPRLERVWNYFDDLDKVSGCGAEAFWKRADQGLIFNFDKELELTPGEKTAMQSAADELVHKLRRTMAVRGTDVTPLGSDVANFSEPIDAIVTLIAGATGIPKRILVGSEAGELASTQDRENWETRVTDRRTDFAEPWIVRPLVTLLIERGALPEPTEWNVRWPEMESLTEGEQADVADKWAGLNEKAGGPVVMPEEIRDRALRLPPFTEEQLAEIEAKQAEEDAKEQELAEVEAQASPDARVVAASFRGLKKKSKYGIPHQGGTKEYAAAYYKIWKLKKQGLPAPPTPLPPGVQGPVQPLPKFDAPAMVQVASPPKPYTGLPLPPGVLPKAPAPPPIASAPSTKQPGQTVGAFNANHLANIHSYQVSSGTLNRKLRTGSTLGSSGSVAVASLDSAFVVAPVLTSPTKVYRGVPSNVLDQYKAAGVGAVFEDKGYVSTSKRADIFGQYKLHIHVPAGSKHIDVNAALGKKSVHHSEHEVLLPRGSKFKIRSFGNNTIDVELVS